MIAPLREEQAVPQEGLSVARRAVAAVLFRHTTASGETPRVGRLVTLAFVGWLLIVTASYFLLDAWWVVDAP